jgi:hypothetical protein
VSTDLFLPLLLIQMVWFLLPGLGVSIWLVQKKEVNKFWVLPVACIVSSLLGYFAFWIFLVSRPLGHLYSTAVFVTAIVLLVKILSNNGARKLLYSIEVLLPLSLWCLVTLFFASTVLSCQTVTPVVDPSQTCYLTKTTTDNILPKLFSDNVYDGHPKDMLGDWQGSDRPPLQSGIALMEAPVTESMYGNMSYLLLAIFLQAMWVPAVWLLARGLRLNSSQLTIVFLLCLSNGFLFLNSIFTWPKLLAGSLAAIGLGLMLFAKPSRVRWLLAGIAVGLSLLAHGGVIFALIPAAILLCRKQFFPGWKIALTAVIAAGLLFIPWFGYQHIYDPPGDRLLKWEIAGVIPADHNSFGQDFRNSYEHAGFSGTIHNKTANTYTLFATRYSLKHLRDHSITSNLRDLEFRFMFISLGLLNFAWLGLFIPSLRRRLEKSGINLARLKFMLIVALASLAFWIIAMFGPGTTIAQSSSYLTMLLLFVSLTAILTTFPRWSVRSIVAVKLVYFLAVWVLAMYLHETINNTYVILMALSGIGIASCLYRLHGCELPAHD